MSEEKSLVSVSRSDLSGTEMVPISEETSSAVAIAAQAEARIKARAAIAISRPRDMDGVRVKLLAECKRPGFAATARYSIPRGGKKIEGPTIRFAEAAARSLGNLDVYSEIVVDDTAKRVIQVSVVDLESNHAESLPVVVEKIMERRQLREGEFAVGQRRNSAGQAVYIVAVPDSEMPVRQGAAVAKARRNLILSHLPADILEECMARVVETSRAQTQDDPEAVRKLIADAFAEIGVAPEALKAYLGCPLNAANPVQLDELRAIYLGIRDGHATWSEIAKEKVKGAGEGGSKIDELKSVLAEKRRKQQGAKVEEESHDPETGEVFEGGE